MKLELSQVWQSSFLELGCLPPQCCLSPAAPILRALKFSEPKCHLLLCLGKRLFLRLEPSPPSSRHPVLSSGLASCVCTSRKPSLSIYLVCCTHLSPSHGLPNPSLHGYTRVYPSHSQMLLARNSSLPLDSDLPGSRAPCWDPQRAQQSGAELGTCLLLSGSLIGSVNPVARSIDRATSGKIN